MRLLLRLKWLFAQVKLCLYCIRSRSLCTARDNILCIVWHRCGRPAWGEPWSCLQRHYITRGISWLRSAPSGLGVSATLTLLISFKYVVVAVSVDPSSLCCGLQRHWRCTTVHPESVPCGGDHHARRSGKPQSAAREWFWYGIKSILFTRGMLVAFVLFILFI